MNGQYCYPGNTLLPWGPSFLITDAPVAMMHNWLSTIFGTMDFGSGQTDGFDENVVHLRDDPTAQRMGG